LFFPQWITSISFQLSYGATLGLILCSSWLHKSSTSKNTFLHELYGSMKDELKISLAAQMFTVPIIFFYFKQISIIAPMSNVLVAWTMAPLMIFGFAAALLGKIHYNLGLLPAYVCFALLHYILITVETISRIPFIFYSF
jgi:competence protein ComEC